MPGAFAHLTAVAVASEKDRLTEIFEGDGDALYAFRKRSSYLYLGSVSPDYPYLKLFSGSSEELANAMHYDRTGDRLKNGIRTLREYGPDHLRDPANTHAATWLMGFAAHIVMDVTVHPVVERKVGKYDENKGDHRECEMNQDVFIFQDKMNVGSPGDADYIASRLKKCIDPINEEQLHPAVKDLWTSMFLQTDLGHVEADIPPDIDSWHSSFLRMTNIAEEGDNFFNLARYIGEELALFYPEEVNTEFTQNLVVPTGETMDYSDIFRMGVENVEKMWNLIYRALFQGDDEFETAIRNWDLDTGRDKETNELEYWRTA